MLFGFHHCGLGLAKRHIFRSAPRAPEAAHSRTSNLGLSEPPKCRPPATCSNSAFVSLFSFSSFIMTTLSFSARRLLLVCSLYSRTRKMLPIFWKQQNFLLWHDILWKGFDRLRETGRPKNFFQILRNTFPFPEYKGQKTKSQPDGRWQERADSAD